MAGLSDDLRTRIADSIQAVDDWRGVTDPTILADAVIRELKLDQPVDFTSVARGIPSFDNGTANE